MSRGPGKVQRAIIEALKTREYIFMSDIFPRYGGRSQRFVFRRAAERLAAQGLVSLEHVHFDLCVTPRDNSPDVPH
jgi:hypothetical protein